MAGAGNPQIKSYKICCKCHIEKSVEDFYNYTSTGVCKECTKKRQREYEKRKRLEYKINPQKFTSPNKKCWCCQQVKDKTEFYTGLSTECIECIRKLRKNYQQRNFDKIQKYRIKYYAKNKSISIQNAVNYENRKRKIDPIYRAKRNFHALFARFKNGKPTRMEDIVGYSYTDFTNYFRNELIDSNQHLDHIIPKILYDHSDNQEIRKCWALRNLRFIDSYLNRKKGKQLDWGLIKKYNLYDLLPKGGVGE